MDHLHEQEFASFLIDIPSNIMQAHFYSCVGLGANTWLLTHPTTLTFHLSSTHFLITLCSHLGLPHPMVAHLSWCQCGHTIDDLHIHLFWCPCESEDTTTHDTLQDIITTIVLESASHVQMEVSHLFPHPIRRRMNILITKDGFQTLMDVAIVDLAHIDMV
jgi:hypothetical protein